MGVNVVDTATLNLVILLVNGNLGRINLSQMSRASVDLKLKVASSEYDVLVICRTLIETRGLVTIQFKYAARLLSFVEYYRTINKKQLQDSYF